MRFVRLVLRSRIALAAEALFLRHQLTLYQERNANSRRDMNVTRLILVWLSYWFDWQPALTIVGPETFKRWRRQGWRLLWKTTSKPPGRPPIPPELQALIRQMTWDNLTWGQQRIANELLLKLGLRVSPRTVRKYMPHGVDRGPGQRVHAQRWGTFIRNHAQGLIASGLWADLTRSVQAWLGRISGLFLWWGSRPTASEVHGSAQTDTVVLALLHETVSVPPAWSLDTGAHDLGIAARAVPAVTLDVHPVSAALCWWNRASPHVRHPGSLSKGGSRVIPWRQAA
jgi:hypothetical protein